MARLTQRSNRTAAAGTVAVPERTRTANLGAAIVVPLTVALLWYVTSRQSASPLDRPVRPD
jgi:hypothetical protein